MTPEKIARIRKFLRDTRGKLMHVSFVKRSTGEVREMTCRTGVKKHKIDPDVPAGPERVAFDTKHHMLTVFDMKKKAYRMISLEGVIKIKAGGKEYEA